MKRFITSLFLISLFVKIISHSVYAQLPFEPFAAYNGNPVLPATPEPGMNLLLGGQMLSL